MIVSRAFPLTEVLLAWTPLYATLGPIMADRAFIILKFVKGTPSLASCAQCQHKFFTPNTYYRDPLGAERYLRGKFETHECADESEKHGRDRTPSRWFQ